ncbi:MAG: THUMP domain-containing protein [Candidatus Bathyarchaeota archaeon]|nr:THUMP domain-containing protein [Candidatus Bathyarchaeota archaeon]
MLVSDFNLIVSTARRYENDAISEMWFLLGEIGDRESVVEKTDVSGLVVAKTALDPFKVIEGLRKMLKERPWEFRYTFRVIPVEIVVRTCLEDIKRACVELFPKILKTETFRVTVEKRHTKLSTRKIIDAVAEVIDRKVDLENPDRIVLIEVLGGLTGVSVVRPKGVLLVVKEKSGLALGR